MSDLGMTLFDFLFLKHELNGLSIFAICPKFFVWLEALLALYELSVFQDSTDLGSLPKSSITAIR